MKKPIKQVTPRFHIKVIKVSTPFKLAGDVLLVGDIIRLPRVITDKLDQFQVAMRRKYTEYPRYWLFEWVPFMGTHPCRPLPDKLKRWLNHEIPIEEMSFVKVTEEEVLSELNRRGGDQRKGSSTLRTPDNDPEMLIQLARSSKA